MTTLMLGIPERTIARLIALRSTTGEDLAAVVARLAADDTSIARARDGAGQATPTQPTSLASAALTARPVVRGRYCFQVLGERFGVYTLVDGLASVLNCLADLDADFLQRLAQHGGRTRRHVARNRNDIHSGRADLNALCTVEFRPGWWIGTNYSRSDTRRILASACRVAGLKFDSDVTLTNL